MWKCYKFYSKKVLKVTDETLWCCTFRDCRARLYTTGMEKRFSREEGEHNHASVDKAVINRQIISNSVKRKAIEDVSLRPSKLIQLEIDSKKESLAKMTKRDKQYIRGIIWRARLQQQKLPSTKNQFVEDRSETNVLLGDAKLNENVLPENQVSAESKSRKNLQLQNVYVSTNYQHKDKMSFEGHTIMPSISTYSQHLESQTVDMERRDNDYLVIDDRTTIPSITRDAQDFESEDVEYFAERKRHSC